MTCCCTQLTRGCMQSSASPLLLILHETRNLVWVQVLFMWRKAAATWQRERELLSRAIVHQCVRSMRTAWRTWHDSVLSCQRKRRLMAAAVQRIKHHQLHSAFATWRADAHTRRVLQVSRAPLSWFHCCQPACGLPASRRRHLRISPHPAHQCSPPQQLICQLLRRWCCSTCWSIGCGLPLLFGESRAEH